MTERFANNASGELSAGINDSVTSLSLKAGEGAAFPSSGDFRIVIGNEIIIVGARTTDTLSSLTRGAEGTVAATHATDAAVTLVTTAGSLESFVQDTGNETIAGVKTFSSIPEGPASNPTTANQLSRKTYVDTKVSLTGDETVAGIKTFSSIPLGPASSPTTDNQLARKKYVDDQDATKQSTSEKAANNGYASLDSTGDVPLTQLGNVPVIVAEGFRAYRSTNQSLTGTSITTIVFDTEVFDEGTDYNSSTGEWTVPATGWYDVATYLSFSNPAAGDQIFIAVYVGGSEHSRLHNAEVGNNTTVHGVGGCVPLKLTASDVVTIRASRPTTGNLLPGTESSFFTAKRRYS